MGKSSTSRGSHVKRGGGTSNVSNPYSREKREQQLTEIMVKGSMETEGEEVPVHRVKRGTCDNTQNGHAGSMR